MPTTLVMTRVIWSRETAGAPATAPRAKTTLTGVGPIDVPRDSDGSFTAQVVLKR